MPLVQIPLRAGLEEGVDPKQMPVGKLTLLENGVWKKDNLIEKRFGTLGEAMGLSDGVGEITIGKRLASRGSELLVVDGTNLYARSSNNAWKQIGRVPVTSPTWTPLLDTMTSVASSSIALSGDYLVCAWISGDPVLDTTGTLFVQVINRESRTVLIRATKLGTAHGAPRVIIIGTKAFVVSRSVGNIVAYEVNLLTLAVAAGVNIRADAKVVDGALDTCLLPGTSNFCILYATNAATTRVASFNSALVLQIGPTNVDAAAAANKVAIAAASTGQLYCLIETTQVKLAVHVVATLAQSVAPTNVGAAVTYRSIGVEAYDATSCIVAFTDQTNERTVTYKVSSGGVVDANSERGTHCTQLVSQPFMLDGRCYMVLADYHFATVLATFSGVTTALVEIEVSSKAPTGSHVPHRYVAKIDHLIGGVFFVPTRPVVSGTTALLPSPYLSEVPTVASRWRTGLRLLEVGAADDVVDEMWCSVSFGLETYFACGGLFAFDGQNVFDYGFSRAPVLASSSLVTPAGAIVAGVYVYAAYREFRSAAGVLHRGPTVSFPITYSGTPSQGTLNFANLNLDAKHSLDTGFGANPAYGQRLPIFRSTVGSTKPKRLTIDPSANVVTIDALTRTHAFVDARVDSNIDGSNVTLATRPLLYTEGGILPDEQPPAFVLLHMHQDRLWGVDGSRQQIWFSKSFNDDRGVAPGFSTSFRVLFPRDVRALASLEDKLVVFGDDWISLILGEGPAPNGLNSSLSAPQPLQTDVGCTSPRSVVGMPDGVMFQAQDGHLYLLTRTLEVVWIGKAVQDQLAAYPNIVAAVLVPKQNQVRFCCNSDDGDEGVVLVFDYEMREWSVFKYAREAVPQLAFADAILHNDIFTFLTPDGRVFYEEESTHLDDSDDSTQWVALSFEIAWLSASGPIGWQRVRRVQLLGEKVTNHRLTLEIGFNHHDAYAQSYTFTEEMVATNNDCPTMRVGCQNGASPLCKAIRVRVTDAPPVDEETYPFGNAKGGLFSAIGLEIEPLPGPARHGARHSKV